MINDNKKFNDEQREIITNIGKKYKNSNIALRRFNITSIVMSVFFIGLILVIYSIDSREIFTVIFLGLLGLIVGSFNYYKARKKIIVSLDKNDFEVGLYYATDDSEVKGNNYLKFKQARIALILSGVLWTVMAIVMSFFFFDDSPVEYSDLVEVSGILEEGHLDSDDQIQIKLENNDTGYRIQSIYTAVLDLEELFDEIDLGDEVTFYVGEIKNVNDRHIQDVYYYESNSKVYMGYDLMMKGFNRNRDLGIIMVCVFGLIGVGSIIGYFVYKNKILVNRQQKEKYDLSIQTSISELSDDIFNNNSKPKIVTYAPKSLINFLRILIGIMICCFVLSFIYLENITDKLIASSVLILFTILLAFSYYDVTKSNESVDGNYFYINRWFKIKKFHLSEIKKVTTNPQMAILLDENNKTIARISMMTKNLDKILERFSEFGIAIHTQL